MKGSWVLGKVAGIKIQVHWTFTLLLLWVLFSNFREGGDAASALFSLALVLVLFGCVVLHELGHALMARKYQINTRSITLLPIGGVAALEKIPEKPREELAVALAGPAVNAAIAFLLFLVLPLGQYAGFEAAEWEAFFSRPSLASFLVYLFMANAMLVGFNLIPAFPMDGGRVLRALLGFYYSRARATEIAARLGQAVAFLFLFLGLFLNPFLVIIAIFVYFGAYAENQMVQQEDRLKGHTVREALLTQISLLPCDATLQQAIDLILQSTEKDFLVVREGAVCGILNNTDITRHATRPETPVAEIMQTEYTPVSPEAGLTETIQQMSRDKQKFLPVLHEGRLVGAISSENISEFILLRTVAGSPAQA